MFSFNKISIYKFQIYIIFLLLLLSLTIFLFKKNIIESLDNCAPIKGNTTAGIKNSAGIKSIKKSISKIDHLKKQIDENTTNIKQLNVNIKNVLDLKNFFSEPVHSNLTVKRFSVNSVPITVSRFNVLNNPLDLSIG